MLHRLIPQMQYCNKLHDVSGTSLRVEVYHNRATLTRGKQFTKYATIRARTIVVYHIQRQV